MRELYDPVYYPPRIQGYDDYHQQQQQYRRAPPQYQPPPPVKSSNSRGAGGSSSNSSSSSVFGKFLKLGKSKSDAGPPSGYSSSTSNAGSVSKRGGSRNPESCELDEFRLSPSVIARGPVQKMVHNKANRRDVSRSHSWIYGSVKLASDLPFGYADQFSSFEEGGNHPGGGVGEEEMMEGHHHQGQPQSHYLHTHGVHAMQIPRCQLDYSCTCDCGGDGGGPDFMGMNPGGSVRNGPSPRRGKPPCQGCARDMAMKYALPSSKGRSSSGGKSSDSESFVSSVRKLTWKSLKQVVKKRPSIDTLKKMPPHQQMMMSPGGGPSPHHPQASEYLSAPIVPMPYLSPSAVAAATATQSGMMDSPNMNPMANPQSHYAHSRHPMTSPPMSPQPPAPQQQQQHPPQDYFFPEKKGFYASCNDIYERGGGPPSPPNHVTASVRVRPKRTRQPWQFENDAPSSEFGPVPNYEEDGGEGNPSGLYHSEWDLRNVMSYDMWMNATSNVKPRTGTTTVAMGPPSGGTGTNTSSKSSSGRSHSADARHYHSSGNLHVPPPDYGNPSEPPITFRPVMKQNTSSTSSKSLSSGKIITNGKGSVSSSKSLTSLHSPMPSTKGGSISSSNSSDTLKISTFSKNPSKPSSPAGIVKRGSILAADVSAYQLLKQQTKKGMSSGASTVSSSSSSSHQNNTKTPTVRQPILKNSKQQPKPVPVEIEDAFSESSDDLSDNAITGPSEPSSSMKARGSGSSTPTTSGGGLGVRIAGQGIRMLPNSKSPASSVTTVTTPQKSPSSSVTAVTSRPKRDNNHTTISIIRQTSTGSIVTTTGSSESESDVWSDCHAEPKLKSSMLSNNHKRSSNGTTTVVTAMSNGKMASPSLSTTSNKTATVGANTKRQTMVTFEKQPPTPPKLPPSAIKHTTFQEEDMEFEEYEVDTRQKMKEEAQSQLKSKADNVVSLNVTTSSSSTSGGNQPKATYIKHTKSSTPSSLSTSSSGSSSTSKFGALRRRKSRNSAVSGCTSPGKLLQETIYEESDPDADHMENDSTHPQRGQSPHHLNHSSGATVTTKSAVDSRRQQKHSVKIMVGAGASSSSSPSQTQSTVKPILKNNNQRTYETPVANPSNSVKNDSCNNDFASSYNGNGTYHRSQDNDDDHQQQIYFDSSVSTTSAKKKVQFDQSKVVVCGGSSSSEAGSGPDEDRYDDDFDENDDSDQWSNKSEEDEPVQEQQLPMSRSLSSNPPQQQQQQQRNSETSTSSSSSNGSADKIRARSLFEEEVARKAASFARSRQQKQQEEEQAAKQNSSNNDVNNLHQQRRHPQQSTSSSSSNGDCSGKSGRTAAVGGTIVASKTTTTTSSSNKRVTNSQGSNGIIVGSSSHANKASSTIQTCHNSDNNNIHNRNATSTNNNIKSSDNAPARLSTFHSNNSTKQTGNSNGNQPQLVINPNSLLFHDTTRIRLNQSRPALHDSTFKLPNNANDGSPTTSPKRGNTRLKQSSSFRSVSSVALRPREPPPPPPKFSLPPGKGSSLASVPARLQKALSTSTLLSKSTEKLNLSGNGKGSSQSHYGPGGRLLPSKSQISLPLGFTTTSKAAGLLVSNSSNSVSSDTIYVPTKNHVTPPATNKKTHNLTNKSSSSSSLASRSKSLTDRCEALEKVLREQKRTEVDEYRPSHSQKLRPAPSLGSLVTTPLPKDDMDSKSIEIVTKENDVSEIRIYSASNSSSNHNTSGGSSDENLPYQGIIYESTKTLITTETPALPPTPTKSVPPPRPSPPEIHYAATDLFPSSQQNQSSAQVHAQSSPQKTPSPKSSPPPPVPTSKESSYECSGKSVVLIIDNNKKKSEQKEDNTPLANYNEPIDTIPRGSSRHKMPPPQIPLPSIPQTYQTGNSADDMGEPLYDDVVNHSAPEPPPPVPKSLAGSLGRKSLKGVVISPPHQLGELPPLPPPPVPPHRTPIQTSSIISSSTLSIQPQVVSSTLPCLACPPSLPPPNLPSKSLSEFHNRPLVIQENEEETLLEEEVDNLYNDIGTPSSTLKSSTAAQFASAVKDAFFGAIGGGNKRNSGDFSDRRSVHSTGSGGSCSVSAAGSAPSKKLISSVVDQQKPQLIYDDTLSVSSSGGGSTASVSSSNSCGGGTTTSRIINHSQKKTVQQMVPLPAPPTTLSNNKSSSELNNQDEDANEEPLYDDVLNLTEQTELSSKNKKEDVSSSRRSLNTIVASEYHSSNSSDSGTEDLPPPLPAQGPPPLPKELPLMTFPLLTPSQQMPPPAVIPNSSSKSKDETLKSTRTLLTELNEKLSKLNVNSASTEGSSNQPVQSSSTSPGGSSDASSGEFNSDSFHISKVVISPSSESSGVEEDYNSEKNYSLSLGGSSTNGSTSSRGGSDNENTYGSNKKKQNATTPTSNVSQSSAVNSENQKNMPSQSITMARGKFLENMKLSMLGNGSSSPTPVNNGPKGLLMMSTTSTVKPTTPLADNDEEEPIYEEIGENLQKVNQIAAPTPTAITAQPPTSNETVDDEDDDDGRSTSPIYADAFDAKSMFDGASRSEILSFLESIRDRLTGAESASSSESQSSTISSSTTKKSSTDLTLSVADSETGKQQGELPIGEKEVEDDGLLKKNGKEEGETLLGVEQPEMQMKASLAMNLKEGEGSVTEVTAEEHVVDDGILILESQEKLLCHDCNDDIEEVDEVGEQINNQHQDDDPTVTTGLAHPGRGSPLGKRKCCRSCNRKRNEKKEIIMEIYETELKYGRDLRIVSDEFYKPIQVAGLLTKEQLDQIFLNVDQLIQINLELTGRLKQEIHRSQQRKLSLMAMGTANNDNKKEDELSEVNVGKIFLELGETMMTAFENYCTRQANAGALLSQLEKEKELLRIFLRVSQMENTVLRRMNLPAFLMVPVQRVTRYPLLLSRLLKVTPVDHFSRDELQSAQEKIELHLEHMNKTTREVASVKLWRRISIINGSSNSGQSGVHRRTNSDLDASNIRIRKMALDVLDWTGFNDVTCVLDNQLGCVHFNGKAMRNIYGCLLVRGKDLELLASKIQDQDPFFPPASEDVVKDVKLVLVRVKNTRFCLLREPLCLSKCVVSQGENEFQEYIEINEITTKNTYFIQGLDKQSTSTWLRYLQCYSSCVGHWRRRRNGLANIMMNGMIKHL